MHMSGSKPTASSRSCLRSSTALLFTLQSPTIELGIALDPLLGSFIRTFGAPL